MPKYVFSEKFLREHFEKFSIGDFLYIEEMYGDFASEIKSVFLRTLQMFDEKSFLVDIYKQSIIEALRKVIMDIASDQPKKFKTFPTFTTSLKYKNYLIERIKRIKIEMKSKQSKLKQS